MPKDASRPSGPQSNLGAGPSTSTAAGPSTESTHAAPLKRGDACLYCRRRRIKCNAAKPACQNCTKLARECVYDTGKPVSRVRQLEDRVAELEGHLRASGGSVPTPAARTGTQAPFQTPMTHVTSAGFPDRIGTETMAEPVGGLADAGIAWDTLDPSLVTLMNQLSETSTSGLGSLAVPQMSHQHQQALHQHVADIPPIVDMVVQRVPLPGPAPVAGQGTPSDVDGFTPIASRAPASLRPPMEAKVPETAFLRDDAHGRPALFDSTFSSYTFSADSDPHAASQPSQSSQTPFRPQLTFNIPVGGWWDPNDIPAAARDQLLHSFFSGQKIFKIFHVPRFMASLTLPPSKRPHPCLLNAIYLMSAFKSPNPALKSLESHFLNIAITRLNESVSALDRLFDAVRAATILAVYRFQKTQYQAGVLMTAQASQLAYTLGLHQIRSSVWRPPSESEEGGGPSTMRNRTWMCSPAKDAIEHGERINAFWALYAVDRTSALASQWPAIISEDEIITPYPRNMYEYEMGLVSPQDDYTLSSMWDNTRPPQILPPHTLHSHHILFLRTLSLLERASKLMYLPDEVGVDLPVTPNDFEHAYTSVFFDIDRFIEESNKLMSKNLPAPTSDAFANSRTARIRTPKAYEKVHHGLMSIEADLPPTRRTKWGEPPDATPGWWEFELWSTEVAGLMFMLGIAWMFLFDVYAPYADNTKAVNVARRLVRGVRAKPASEYKDSDENLIVTVCLSFISMILVRELRRLHGIGQHAEAAAIQSDLNAVVEALKMMGLPNFSRGETDSGSGSEPSGPSRTSPPSQPSGESAGPSGPFDSNTTSAGTSDPTSRASVPPTTTFEFRMAEELFVPADLLPIFETENHDSDRI